MKRVLWLASAALFLSVVAAVAQDVPYIIRNGAGSGAFSVTRSNKAVATDVPMDFAISEIRETSFGLPITIQFGGAGDSVLKLGNETVYIVRGDGDSTKWGALTLTGSIASGGVYVYAYDSDTLPFSLTSKLNVSAEGATAFGVSGNVALAFVGGKISTAGQWSAALSVSDKKAAVKITGGEFEAKDGGRALVMWDSYVSISDTAVKITSGPGESGANPALEVYTGNLELGGGTITNKDTSGYAVRLTYQSAAVTFKGAVPPNIVGGIVSKFPGAIRMDASFKPGSKKYTLVPIGAACADGVVAVKGGGSNLANFTIVNKYYQLEKKDSDIIVKLKAGVAQPKYVITGDTAVGFTAAAAADTVGKNVKNLSYVLDSIRIHADGRPCGIQFGNGTAALDAASYYLTFGSEGWGRVSFTGKLLLGGWSMVYLEEGVSAENSADIGRHAGSEGGAVVRVFKGADLTNKSGTVKPAINNGGTLTVSGGTVGDTANISYCAIENGQSGEVIISGTANIVSADTSGAGGTIKNSGSLTISGGKVSSFSTAEHRVAVFNGVYDTDTMAAVTISGTAEIYSAKKGRSESDFGVINNARGSMEISGGKIYSGGDTIVTVIANRNNAKLVISGSADIKSEAGFVQSGVIFNRSVLTGRDSAAMTLEISGGKISANGGFAVRGGPASKTSVSGTAELTSAFRDGVVYVHNGTAQLYLLGGTVSSTCKDSVKIAVQAITDGRGGAAGRITMGGSPAVTGSIGYEGQANGKPIIILAAGAAAFSPGSKKYNLSMVVQENGVILTNGARFISSFVLDTAVEGNSGIKLAANGNDVVATKGRIWNVSFNLNGSTGVAAPATIPVIDGGTIGELSKPSTAPFLITKSDGKKYGNDGEWHYHNGSVGDQISVGDVFVFGVGVAGDPITKNTTLTLLWTNEAVSVLKSDREIPAASGQAAAAIAPVAVRAAEFTAGPNPSALQAGKVGFFWNGAALKSGKLAVFDAAGNAVNKVMISDAGAAGRRAVAVWNLTDTKGRLVSNGTYVVKGVINTKSGKTEKVSILLGVR